jgi:hypothetical protein
MDHPGMIPVFESGSAQEGELFYVMRKVTGRTFRAILRERRPEDVGRPRETARLIRVFEELCQAVAYAHALQVVHRDLKPQNVMVDDYSVVHVLDWGLAKRLRPTAEDDAIMDTRPGIIKGTPAYMSPEQATGKHEDVDFRTDVFALGIILYEILTGRLPFEGKTHTEVLTKIVEHEPADLRQTNRGVSRVLAAVCMKALNKDPAQRYPTAKEMATDIRLYRDYLPTSAYRPRLMDRLGNWMGRHPALASGIGTTLVLVLLFGGLVYLRHTAAQIRIREQQRSEQVARAVQELREKQTLDAMIAFMKELDKEIDAIDDDILAVQKQKATDDPKDAATVRRLDAKLQELQTARNWHVEHGQVAAGNIILFMSRKKDWGAAEQDKALMKSIRDLMIEDVTSLLAIGDYYTADNHAWRYLIQSRRIGWDEAETAELLDLKGQIEAKLKESRGPDAVLPNWEQYAPQKVPMDIYWPEQVNPPEGAPEPLPTNAASPFPLFAH